MKALFVDKFKQHKFRILKGTPNVGDVIPIFGYNPHPRVTQVIWFPEEFGDEFKGLDIDIVLIVE